MFYHFESLFSSKYVDFQVAFSKDSADPYFRITGSDSVIVLLLDSADNFILVRQFRPPLNLFTTEFPAGSCAFNELPFQAAQREVFEEIGVIAPLISLAPPLGLLLDRTDMMHNLYFGMSPVYLPNYKPEPGLSTFLIPRLSFLQFVYSGQFIQLSALSLFPFINDKLGLDFFKSDYNSILRAFSSLSYLHFQPPSYN